MEFFLKKFEILQIKYLLFRTLTKLCSAAGMATILNMFHKMVRRDTTRAFFCFLSLIFEPCCYLHSVSVPYCNLSVQTFLQTLVLIQMNAKGNMAGQGKFYFY